MSTQSNVRAALAERELQDVQDGTLRHCKHQGCDCSIAGHEDYCCDACEMSDAEVPQSCQCGHSECTGDIYERWPEPSQVR